MLKLCECLMTVPLKAIAYRGEQISLFLKDKYLTHNYFLIDILLQPMKLYQMRTSEKNMTNLAMEDKEIMAAPSNNRLISTLMTCSKILTYLVKVRTPGRRSTLKITSGVIGRLTVGKDVHSTNFPLEVDCLMMCLKIWKKCFPSVALTMHTDTLYELIADSMDLASIVGLSLSVEETWLLHIQTVLDSNPYFSPPPSSFYYLSFHFITLMTFLVLC